jgi:hypothetical protein
VLARPNVVRLGLIVVLGTVFALTLWLLAPGLFGLSPVAPATTKVSATVTKGATCGQAPDGEIVTFKQDGQQHQAKFDGCGHRDGEPVDVGVPVGQSGPNVVVHAAEATTGGSGASRGLAFLFFLFSSFAGGGFAFNWFWPLIPPKRQPTASEGTA